MADAGKPLSTAQFLETGTKKYIQKQVKQQQILISIGSVELMNISCMHEYYQYKLILQ